MKLELRRTSWLLLGYLAGCTWIAPQPAPIKVQGNRATFGALATYRGSLGGWLQPYRDPDLSCWMDTWFEGRLV